MLRLMRMRMLLLLLVVLLLLLMLLLLLQRCSMLWLNPPRRRTPQVRSSLRRRTTRTMERRSYMLWPLVPYRLKQKHSPNSNVHHMVPPQRPNDRYPLVEICKH